MPKMKTKKSAQKRFRVTKSGKVKAKRANLRHILTNKAPGRKRALRKKMYLNNTDARTVKILLQN